MQETGDYLDHCRTRRNTVEYSHVGSASEDQVEELLRETRTFRAAVLAWLGVRHPDLRPMDGAPGEPE